MPKPNDTKSRTGRPSAMPATKPAPNPRSPKPVTRRAEGNADATPTSTGGTTPDKPVQSPTPAPAPGGGGSQSTGQGGGGERK